ncbi:hypothetical protein [Nannocystis radixulma]|uniref:Intein C-terminal splicing domain-containing protein n=1 Tax=Nannocystis radixulma TaxID=2995305 RepID=A0ABT5B927_9BACT|nr:hypothetical protein [Nannocystis radixulma]MDC0670635.1 hypothetical protein [Nannocystis radixulma]
MAKLPESDADLRHKERVESGPHRGIDAEGSRGSYAGPLAAELPIGGPYSSTTRPFQEAEPVQAGVPSGHVFTTSSPTLHSQVPWPQTILRNGTYERVVDLAELGEWRVIDGHDFFAFEGNTVVLHNVERFKRWDMAAGTVEPLTDHQLAVLECDSRLAGELAASGTVPLGGDAGAPVSGFGAVSREIVGDVVYNRS